MGLRRTLLDSLLMTQLVSWGTEGIGTVGMLVPSTEVDQVPSGASPAKPWQ